MGVGTTASIIAAAPQLAILFQTNLRPVSERAQGRVPAPEGFDLEMPFDPEAASQLEPDDEELTTTRGSTSSSVVVSFTETVEAPGDHEFSMDLQGFGGGNDGYQQSGA